MLLTVIVIRNYCVFKFEHSESNGCTQATIFARHYGTAAVISYNLKGIAPPVPPIQCWADKNLMSGCAAPTLKWVGAGRVENMYQKLYITTECM